MYMDEVLYTLSSKKIKMNALDDLDEIKEISLPGNSYTPWYY
jgi:hypothetical protein